MLKRLLATTAIVAVAGVAGAAETADPAMNEASGELYLQSATSGDHLASNLMGLTVYSSTADDAEMIGDINNFVFGDDGTIEGVVIGVGGFLGVGEKVVAIRFDQIQWEVDENGTQYAVLETDREGLENAPAFDTAALEPQPEDGMMSDDMSSEQDTAMSDDTMTEDDMAAEQDTAMTDDEAMSDEQISTPARDALAGVEAGTISADELIGTTVFSGENENVGNVGDVLVADDGSIEAVIVDVGGFLGLGVKPVAISFEELDIRQDENGDLYVYTAFSQDQLEAAPEYDEAS